jgi:hypothetical protein
MSDPKTLKFQFQVDEASLQKTRQVIRELTSDLTKLNEAAGKFGGGGGGLGGGGFGGGVNIFGGGAKSPESQRVLAKTAPVGRQLVQGFLDQKQIFKGISDGSKDSMRVMTDALHKAIGSQTQDLRHLENVAKELVETYDELTEKINKFKTDASTRTPGWAKAASEAMSKRTQIQEQLQKNLSDQNKATSDLDALKGMDPAAAAKNARFFGQGGSIWNTNNGVMSNLMAQHKPAWLGMALRMGGYAMMGANGALNESLATYSGMGALGAARVGAINPMFQGLMGGDVKSIFTLHRMQQDERDDMRGSALSVAAQIDRYKNATFQAIKSPVSRGDGTGATGGFTTAAQGTAALQASLGNLQTQTAAMDPRTAYAIDQFGSSLMSRVGVNRILGTGLSTGKTGDSFGRLQARLMENGYTPDQLAGAFTSLRGQAGGRFAGRYAGAAMAAQAAGYGGFGELLGAGARSSGSADIAYGAIGGGIDKSAGLQLGHAIIGSGFDPMGTTSGLGVLSAAQQSGMFSGGAGDFNQVQRVSAGLGLGSQITTGALDPYQRGRNLVSSIGILGGGASTYAQDFLGNGMNLKQMMDMAGGGKLTATASALGLSRGDISKQLSNSVGSVFDRYYDSGSNDPMARTIRAFRKSGKSIEGYLGGLHGKARSSAVSTLGAYYGLETGAGEEAGIGLMGLESGMSKSSVSKLLKAKGLGGGVGGDVEKEALHSMAVQAKNVSTELTGIASELKAAWAHRTEISQALGGMSDLSKNVDDFIGQLSRCTAGLAVFADKLGVKAPPPGPKVSAPKPTVVLGTPKQMSQATQNTYPGIPD